MPFDRNNRINDLCFCCILSVNGATLLNVPEHYLNNDKKKKAGV